MNTVNTARISMVNNFVFPLGRVTPTGVSLLGTSFLINKVGKLVTAAHVTNNDDTNLVVIAPKIYHFGEYQDTTDLSVNYSPVKIHAIDPFSDLCVLDSSILIQSPVTDMNGTDSVDPGENISIFSFPHADHGRMVLTQQVTEIGAKVLIAAGELKTKHIVLNIQARPGQSGGPVFKGNSLVGVLIGSYAPGGGSGLSLAGVDPYTLHQTTHAVSAEYIKEMI